MLKYFLYFSQKTERPNTVNIYAEPEQDLFLRDERLKGGLGGGWVVNKNLKTLVFQVQPQMIK